MQTNQQIINEKNQNTFEKIQLLRIYITTSLAEEYRRHCTWVGMKIRRQRERNRVLNTDTFSQKRSSRGVPR